jgi:hypothetical protein
LGEGDGIRALKGDTRVIFFAKPHQ